MPPISHIFTDLSKVSTQEEKQAFGPLGNNPTEKEKKFNLTNIFTSTADAPAYAVTDGILFIVPQKDSTDLVNVFLKPTNPVDLGLKIKYYVYRGIKKGNYFEAGGSSVDELLKKNNPNILPFLTKIWDEFLEFNKIPAANATTVPFEAKKIGFSTTIPADYQAFFTKDQYTLPKVKIGEQIGEFGAEFGFEVVVDEGDFAQGKSDTGFEYKQDYFTANKCVLNLDANNATNVYGNLPSTVSEKVFRETIYLFLDPAAYYGSHVTINSDKNKGGIKKQGATDAVTSPQNIYVNFISKFYNKNVRYLYIKHTRNRSYNFYNTNTNPIIIADLINDNNKFEFNKWPLRIFSNIFSLRITLKIFLKNPILYRHIGISTKVIYEKNDLLTAITQQTPTQNFRQVYFELPFCISGKISSLVYLSYDDGIENQPNGLFGNINLKSIFEREDFASGQGSFVNHLRPILIKDGEEIAVYQTKVLLEGQYIADTVPPALPSVPAVAEIALSKNLRTYILFPQASTLQKEGDTPTSPLTAGYYTAKNMEEYITVIYGGGEIWKGMINDGSNITSLQYRRKEGDKSLPIYQLGISQKDYLFLEGKAQTLDADATNLFFQLEEDTPSSASNFMRYKLKIQLDKKDGTLGLTTDSVSLYTTDGYFLFTKDYSANFKYGKEFAETTVEFRPHQDWDGEFGMDWYRKGQNTWPSDPDVNKIYDAGFAGNVGTIPTQTDGNSYSKPFVADSKMLSQLKKKEYDVYPTTWTLADNETECFVSWLSLDKGKTAKLNLRIRVKKEAGKLRIRYPKKYFKITTAGYPDPLDDNFNFYDFPPAQKTVTTAARLFDLEITCIEEFSFTQTLEVKADDKLAGVLKAFRNSNKPVQNILFVPIKIEMPDFKERGFTPGIGESPVATDYLINQKKWLEQFLLHSQIKANVEMFKKFDEPLQPGQVQEDEWNLTEDSNFKQQFDPANNKGMFVYKFFSIPGNPNFQYTIRAYYEPDETAPYTVHAPANYIPLKEYLLLKLPTKYKATKYNNYLIVFFINNAGYSMHTDTLEATGLNGFSDGIGTHLLVFKLDNDNNETVSHELYHSLGIPHVFNKLDKNSLYVYKAKQTDNLLDYTHLKIHSTAPYGRKYDRRSLYHWQWIVARKNVKI